jgi:hypothetical protein
MGQGEPMTPVFSWLARFAGYLQKPWIIAIVIAAVAAVIAGLILTIRYTRATGIVLRVLGVIFLAGGLVLVYVKFRVLTVKVPSTWVWIPAIGIAFIVAAWLLRRQRTRAVHNRIRSLAAATAERIDALKQKHHETDWVDLLTTDGGSVVPLLGSLLRRSRRGKCIVLVGLPGSGKTATLLKFAEDCQRMRSARKRPIVAIYVDLAEYYVARTTEDLLLAEFIQRKFHGLDLNKAWDENGRDVSWVFLFDNADEADLRWGYKEQSWQLITSFIRGRSRSAPFYGIVASQAWPETIPADYVIELGGLTNRGWKKLLIEAGIDKEATDELAQDKSFQWYLRDPGTLRLLAPVLAHRGWATRDDVYSALTTSDNVHKVMGDAVVFRMRSRLPSTVKNLQPLQATAMTAIKFLKERPGFIPFGPVEVGQDLERVADARGSSLQQIDDNLTALEKCGILKRTPGPDNAQYIAFTPAVAAYFYTCVLLESPNEAPVLDLLRNRAFRLAAISLLNVADTDMVDRFVQETERLLDLAITGLTTKSTPRDAAPHRTQLHQLAYLPYAALSILVDGLQNRLEVLDNELREMTTEFIKHAMRIANPRIQAGLLEVSQVLGTREQAISTMTAGLASRDSTIVFLSAGMVNALSEREVTELEDEHRDKLVSVIIMVGLRSLTLNQGRDNVPSTLRLADDAGVAAIILYGIVFGLGGVLQLINFWHHHSSGSNYPFPQIFEILAAVLVSGSIALARYNARWRQFVLRQDFRTAMTWVSGSLAVVGGIWAAFIVFSALATFTMPLMPLLVCYSLAWPALALLYLTSDKCPTITNTIFPLPRVVEMLWHAYRD